MASAEGRSFCVSNATNHFLPLYQVGPNYIALYLLPPGDKEQADSPAVQPEDAHPAAKKKATGTTAAARKRAAVALATARVDLAHMPALPRPRRGAAASALKAVNAVPAAAAGGDDDQSGDSVDELPCTSAQDTA